MSRNKPAFLAALIVLVGGSAFMWYQNPTLSGGDLVLSSGIWVDTRSAGVKWDGTTDDQAAWNAATANASNRTLLAPGSASRCSMISRPIVMYNLLSFRLQGSGNGGPHARPCIQWLGPSSSISTITCNSNVLTITTTAPHSWVKYESVTISGNDRPVYNTPPPSSSFLPGDDIVAGVPTATTFTVNRNCVNGTGSGGTVSGGSMVIGINLHDPIIDGITLLPCAPNGNCATVGFDLDQYPGGLILTNSRIINSNVSYTVFPGNHQCFRFKRTSTSNGEKMLFDHDVCDGSAGLGRVPTQLFGTGIGYFCVNGGNTRVFEVARSDSPSMGIGVVPCGTVADIHDSSGLDNDYVVFYTNPNIGITQGRVANVHIESSREIWEGPHVNRGVTIENSRFSCSWGGCSATRGFFHLVPTGNEGHNLNIINSEFEDGSGTNTPLVGSDSVNPLTLVSISNIFPHYMGCPLASRGLAVRFSAGDSVFGGRACDVSGASAAR